MTLNVPRVREYRSASQHGRMAILGSIALAAIGFWAATAGSFYCLPLWGIAVVGFIYGCYFLLDNSVKLRIDTLGIYCSRLPQDNVIKWRQIEAASCIRVTQGANIRHFLKLRMTDGSERKIEISRLDESIENILEEFYSFYERR